jgi:hypothetical protein
MRSLFFTLSLLLSVNVFSAGVVNIWYTESDTTTIGEQFSIFIKCSYTNTSDSGRVYIKNLTTNKFVQVYKFKILELLQETPTGQDDTYELIIAIPSYVGKCELFGSGNTGTGNPVIFVRSDVPDFSISWLNGSPAGYSGFAYSITVKWSYKEQLTDTMRLSLNETDFLKIPLTELKHDSTISFNLIGEPGIYQLTGNYILNTPLNHINYTILTPVSTSIVTQIEEKEEIIYYNMQGVKIEKPNEGFYLWKSEKGSGKVMIRIE